MNLCLPIYTNEHRIEQIEQFMYQGKFVPVEGDTEVDVTQRINSAKFAFAILLIIQK